ncbi:MAG: MarR family EPS-associated transcriptional regulator [Burkholderiales bacterium]|nr:MarR family EPS-associated transcriptional regulator [Burkholderiales bacterium]
MPGLTDPQRLELLKLLQEQPQMSQRDLAQAMGVSLGKANYCLNALMEKGLVKLERFRTNPDKRNYAYLLTPAGLKEKTRITMEFLRYKVAEYEALEKEIAQLRGDLENGGIQSAGLSEQQSGNP